MKWRRYGAMLARLVGITAVILLVACSQPAINASDTTTAAEVHQRWIAAVQVGDRASALLLYADHPQREQLVDQAITSMQGYLTPSVQRGAFQGVDLYPPTRRGQDQVGLSRWRFARLTWCYETILVATSVGWRVAQWGQAGRCPDEVH